MAAIDDATVVVSWMDDAEMGTVVGEEVSDWDEDSVLLDEDDDDVAVVDSLVDDDVVVKVDSLVVDDTEGTVPASAELVTTTAAVDSASDVNSGFAVVVSLSSGELLCITVSVVIRRVIFSGADVVETFAFVVVDSGAWFVELFVVVRSAVVSCVLPA